MIVIEILIILMYIALYVCSMHRFILELNLIHFPIFWYHQTTTLTERTTMTPLHHHHQPT